jgi:hypothetical protein
MTRAKKSRASKRSGRGRTQWKESEAREALAQWRRSGLSASAFATRHGYSETRLWYWSKRLGADCAEPEVSFVPVRLEARASRQVEIEHGGVVLRVREDLGAEQIARLVTALAAARQGC